MTETRYTYSTKTAAGNTFTIRENDAKTFGELLEALPQYVNSINAAEKAVQAINLPAVQELLAAGAQNQPTTAPQATAAPTVAQGTDPRAYNWTWKPGEGPEPTWPSDSYGPYKYHEFPSKGGFSKIPAGQPAGALFSQAPKEVSVGVNPQTGKTKGKAQFAVEPR